MRTTRSPKLQVRARGPLACFTRPELKVERVSYPIPTPSACRGLLEAVLWKPAIAWRVERIQVLNSIEFTAFRRNEVCSKAPVPRGAVINNGGEYGQYHADDDRTQRNTVALRDVDYVIECHFELTAKAEMSDNITKFVEMFERRVSKGQHFHQPYFGCREFIAEVLPVKNAPRPISLSKDLGLMLWDIKYSSTRNIPIFFRARIEDGVIEVPADLEKTENVGGAV